MKLNIGCGPVQPPGWVNIDNSNRAKLAKRLPWLDRLCVRCHLFAPTEFGPQITIANLLKPWPFADNSCQAVYAGDVWSTSPNNKRNGSHPKRFAFLAPAVCCVFAPRTVR
jgi:hypothetical protein